MEYIHKREYLSTGDVVELACDTQCNFMLTDDVNYSQFERGRSFRYYGGHFTSFPARIAVPACGHWNITLDLGGGGANIRYGFRIIRG